MQKCRKIFLAYYFSAHHVIVIIASNCSISEFLSDYLVVAKMFFFKFHLNLFY